MNQFLQEGVRVSKQTLSKEGAKKYVTSLNDFVDQFSSISYYKEPRSFEQVQKDMELLWSKDPLLCLKLAVYIRLITRKSKTSNQTFDLQKGQGLKNEGILRFYWIAINYPETFKKNIGYFIAAGCWKDIFQMLAFDCASWRTRKLDWNFFQKIILAGLNNPSTTHLVRKYLPTIRTNKNCTTIESKNRNIVGRWIARTLFETENPRTSYKLYRQLKSKGLAHQWQQKISRQLYQEIDFSIIAGRALNIIVNSKFLQNHNLVKKYQDWIKNKPEVNYTGFVFELFLPLGDNEWPSHIEPYKEAIINAQFKKLLNNEQLVSKLIVARDVSGSMWGKAKGCKMSAYGIAKAMALYFSQFLKGEFANSFIAFSSSTELRSWKGKTYCDKWITDGDYQFGATNFQSVINLFIDLYKKGVNIEDFPEGILCISDGEFSDCGDSTNFKKAIQKLEHAGFPKDYIDNFKIILWDIPNRYYGDNSVKFEDFADAHNFYYMSGYDPSAISFLLEGKDFKASPKNAEELFWVAMDQPLLNSLKVIDNEYPF